MNIKTTIAAGISAIAISMAAPLAAQAQEAMPEAPAETPTIEVNDEQLQSFAVAFLEVAEISQQYQPELEGAESAEQQDQVRTEAGERMIDAVESVDGISVEEYQQILQAAQTDPDLAQRINTQISQLAE